MRKLLLMGVLLGLAGCNTVGGPGDYSYNDLRKPHGRSRNDAALQVDTRYCDRRTGGQQAYATPAFDQCMRQRGWAFASFSPAQSDDADSSSPPDDSQWRQLDDFHHEQDQINTQNMINTQDMLNNQQMLNDQQNMLIQQNMANQ